MIRRDPSGATGPFPMQERLNGFWSHEADGRNPHEKMPPPHGCFWRRQKWVILGSLLTGVTLSLAWTLLSEPVFRARTTIEIGGLNAAVLAPAGVPSLEHATAAEIQLQTQINILRSESLCRRALSHMEALPAEVNQPLRGPAVWIRRLRQPGFKGPENTELQVARVMRHLTVRPVAQSRVIEILFDSRHPEFAAAFANQLASEYARWNSEQRWKTITETLEWLKPELQNLKEHLQRSGRQIEAALRLRAEADAEQAGLGVKGAKIQWVQRELMKAQKERAARQLLYEQVSAGPAASLSATAMGGALRDYQTRLSDLKRRRAELAVSLKPDRQRMEALEAQISDIERLILDEWFQTLKRALNEYTTALRREQALSEQLAAMARAQTGSNPARREKDPLPDATAGSRLLYDFVIQRLEDAAVASTIQGTHVRILDHARAPALPYKPDFVLHAGVGSMMGFLLGMGMAMTRERAGRRLIGPGRIAEIMNVPELGVIPSARLDPGERTRKGRYFLFPASNHPREPLELVTLRRKLSILAESYRTALTSILLASPDGKRPQVLTFTSVTSGEGKTTVVSNLAIALAEIHRQVVLIEGDLRNPRLSNAFNIANSWGLTDILNGSQPIEDMPIESLVRPTEVPGLKLLPSGPATANLFTILHSPRLAALLRHLRKRFDAVLIDSCPMLHLQDARILGGLSDAVILVVRPGASGAEDLYEALERLKEDHTAVLGVILNDWNPRASGRKLDEYYGPYHARQFGIPL